MDQVWLSLYFSAIQDDRNIIQASEAEVIIGYVSKVKGIRDVLTRDHMKVAFFGR